MKFQYRLLLFVLCVIVTTGCFSATPTAAADWQTYSNTEAGFSIRYPSTWKFEDLPDQNGGALHGVSLKGAEGGVELYWGTGLGGGCTPEGIQKIKVAQGELPSCYGENADGTKHWENISKKLSNTSFSARAYTTDATASSDELVLQVISTISFP
jgi:hypothetical protein